MGGMGRYESDAVWGERAGRALACGGAQTLSKAPERHGGGDLPRFFVRGQGCRVYDMAKRGYVDYTLALGPVTLGYGYESVQKAVHQAVDDGPLFSLEHPVTVQVAECLTMLIPGCELVRYTKTGSEANAAACRVARTYTGRPVVLTSGYHGHGDLFQANAGDERGRAGVPECLRSVMIEFPFGDIDELGKLVKKHKPAAVLLEPARTFEPPAGYLRAVRDLCTKHGVVLIFDEVVTGFRWANGGAAERYGVTPDLTVLGKAAANGYAFSAVCGQRDVMAAFDRCFVSSTYGGDTVGLSAALATMQVYMQEPVIDHLWRQGRRHREAYNHIMTSMGIPAHANGVDVCWIPTFTGPRGDVLRRLYIQEMAHRGIWPGTISYISYSHDDEALDDTIEQMGFVAEILRREVGID